MTTMTRPKPINAASNDYVTNDGVRISSPLYCDLTQQQRKALLNALRERVNNEGLETRTPNTTSGISVVTNSSMSRIEEYLGMNVDTLRSSVLFQRGGLEISLLLRLQEITGLSFVTAKDIGAAFTSRKKLVSDYIANNPLEESADG